MKLKRSQLEAIFGATRVVTDDGTLADYRDDYTELDGEDAAAVVYPLTLEEVQALVRLAIETRTPITPRVANTNVGGLAIPSPGAIVADFSRMDRVLEIDADDMIAVIEPGGVSVRLSVPAPPA